MIGRTNRLVEVPGSSHWGRQDICPGRCWSWG